jgi:hypothetical protein
MKKLLGIVALLALVATTGCEIEEHHRGHRGGVYGGFYGESDRGYGRDRDHYEYYDRDGRHHAYDRDHYYDRDRW